MFHHRRRTGALAPLEQQIDEHAVAAISRHASSRRVRLVDVAVVLELSQDAAHGGGRHPEPALVGEPLRRHWFTGLDVLADECRQQPP